MCGFIKPAESETEWHIRMHGAFKFPHETLGNKHTDQSCHHEVWIRLSCVNAPMVDRASRDGQILATVTSFTCAPVSSAAVSAPQLRTLPQGPCVSSNIQPTIVAEQVTAHYLLIHELQLVRAVQQRKRACLIQAVAEREEICLRPSDPFSSDSEWRHVIMFLRCYTCVTPLEIMPRRVLVHISITETQQLNSVLDHALLVKLVISAWELCQKSVMDCVATHSSWHKKLPR